MFTALTVALAAFATSAAFTAVAVKLALAVDFVDRPKGYKRHLAPTPYLGGAAVIASVMAVTLLATGTDRALIAVLGGTAALAVLGTIDDRVTVAPRWRVASELALAGSLFSVGVHWSPFGVGVLDFALSAAWVVGIVNAFNLMDNIDGAASVVTAMSAVAIGVIAVLDRQSAIAVVAFAVAGSCLGFLPHNLASPARIFLGDGGSMPLGFLVAALSMAALQTRSFGAGAVLAGGLVAGLPILDTTLVVVSRRRRGAAFAAGGRDHLTHRLLARAGSPLRVALLLVIGQGLLVGLSIAGWQFGPGFVVVSASVAVAGGLAAIVRLESPSWRPSEHPGGDQPEDPLAGPGRVPDGAEPSRVSGGRMDVPVNHPDPVLSPPGPG